MFDNIDFDNCESISQLHGQVILQNYLHEIRSQELNDEATNLFEQLIADDNLI